MRKSTTLGAAAAMLFSFMLFSATASGAGKSITIESKSPDGAKKAVLSCSGIYKLNGEDEYSKSVCSFALTIKGAKSAIVIDSDLKAKKGRDVFGDGIGPKEVTQRMKWSPDSRYFVYVYYIGNNENSAYNNVTIAVYDTNTKKATKNNPGSDLIGHQKYSNNPRCVVPYGGLEATKAGIVYYTIKEQVGSPDGDIVEGACENFKYKINKITINYSGKVMKKDIIPEKGNGWG